MSIVLALDVVVVGLEDPVRIEVPTKVRCFISMLSLFFFFFLSFTRFWR